MRVVITWIGAATIGAAMVAAGSVAAVDLSAQTPATRAAQELAVEEIMKGRAFVGTSPSELRWSADGESLYFVWKPPDEEKEGLYRVDRDGGTPRRVDDEAGRRVDARLDAAVSEDRTAAAYAHDGTLYLLDVRSGRERPLFSAPDELSRVQIAPDGSVAYFVRGRDLYGVDVASRAVRQLTDIRSGKEPKEDETDSLAAFMEEQQRELFRVFREDSIRRARSWPPPADTADADTPKPFYVQEGQRLTRYQVAPDGERMAFRRVERAGEARLAWVPDYVTEEGYTERAPRERAKVGDDQADGRLGIMDLETGTVVWVDPGDVMGSGDPAASDEGGSDEDPGRRIDIRFVDWSRDGDRLLAVGISFDYHDRWIFVVDAATGEARSVDHLHDDAWIGGPAWNQAGWMPDGDHVWFVSDASGFSHLYTVAVGGGEPTALTSGPWEVIDVRLGPEDREWYLVTSEQSPHHRGFYRMPLRGGERTLVTTHGTLQGDQGRDIDAVAVSPDGERLAALYAGPNRPPELFLQDNDPGRVEPITRSTTDAFRAYDWRIPEIVYLPSDEAAGVPARLYRPDRANGAGVIFVHGAGYLQNVHRWWSTYYREYMFHNLLVDRGYTVLDIDYRGSAGYGRDWRTAIHRHMGGLDLSDQVAGARYLADSLGIDPARIGIYGGSYGGFITLMAMFTEPETFAAGAALRPVTDWAHYNHWYTSRILGLPQEDPQAYRRSSPIYFAEGLQGALLMCHGMIDQNVHFQDTVRLVQRLIELGKEDWEVAIYPKEDHGFVHTWSWTDEYRRILELFERNLN